MAGTLSLQVVTPERTVVRDLAVEALVVPIPDGSLGILYNHAPMVASLRPGVVKYKLGGKYERMAVSGGFMELSENRAMLLADAAEQATDIDVMRARQAKERAERRLRERHAAVDDARARAALQRALARLRAAGVDEGPEGHR